VVRATGKINCLKYQNKLSSIHEEEGKILAGQDKDGKLKLELGDFLCLKMNIMRTEVS
jgi:hypothetical protein